VGCPPSAADRQPGRSVIQLLTAIRIWAQSVLYADDASSRSVADVPYRSASEHADVSAAKSR